MNTRAEVALRWADGDHLFALKVPQIDELQRVTAKVVFGALVAAGMSPSAAAKAAIDAMGIGAIYKRLLSGEPLYSDVRETIRLGHVGGGKDAIRALQLVETYVDGHPLATLDDVQSLAAGLLPHGSPSDAASNLATAIAIAGAIFIGIEELPKGKASAAATNGTDTSTLRPSTEAGEHSSAQPATSET